MVHGLVWRISGGGAVRDGRRWLFLAIEKAFLYLVCYFTHLWESKNEAFSILDGLSCEVMSLSLAKMEARIFNTFLGVMW